MLSAGMDSALNWTGSAASGGRSSSSGQFVIFIYV